MVHGKFQAKNRYRVNHEATSAISVFGGKKAISEPTTVNSQQIGITLKLDFNHQKSFSVQGQKKTFIDELYSTFSLKMRSFTFDVFH